MRGQKWGTRDRRKVAGNYRPPKSWNNFLRCDENKTKIVGFQADKNIIAQTNAQIIVTKRRWNCLQFRIEIFSSMSSRGSRHSHVCPVSRQSIYLWQETKLLVIISSKSVWVWSANITIIHSRPTHCTGRKSHISHTVIRHQEDN